MQPESDGMAELFEEHLRTALLLGTRLAERHIQRRADEQRQLEAQRTTAMAAEAERARDQQRRLLDAERRQVSRLQRVDSSVWWDHADVDQVREAWITAQQYKGDHTGAERASWRIADTVKKRWGVDVYETDLSTIGLQPRVEQHATVTDDELRAFDRNLVAIRDRAAGSLEGPERDAALARIADIDETREFVRDELSATQGALPAESAIERRRREQNELGQDVLVAGADAGRSPYDSRERRAQLRDRLEQLGIDQDAVDAVLLADVGNAKPPVEAVRTGPTARATQRPQSHRQRSRQQQRRR